MSRTSVLAALGACIALWSGAASAQNETHGCACVENQTPITINYEWKWADNAYAKASLNAGASHKFCWKYLNPDDQASPPLRVRYDYDLSNAGVQIHEYVLDRVRANDPPTCAGVGKPGSYHFRRTRNNTQIQLSKVAQ